ncbi:hypothetical protein GALL_257390 [mine drainage metagenome]|uniref:Uncharacterized protein n=1 Tax=mine drainage metagenome TaxID=410659 RepID=A0A1J5R8W8_9ZZZZ
MSKFYQFVGLLGLCLIVSGSLLAEGVGFDSGDLQTAAKWVLGPPAEAVSKVPGNGRWLRLRAGEDFSISASAANLARVRKQLGDLHRAGWKLCVIVQWGNWSSGTRPGGHLPVDLTEAYDRFRLIGKLYGPWVDAWEIDNEPDIGFVPENAETYAAYLKTAYAALGAGDARCLGLGFKLKPDDAVTSARGAGSDPKLQPATSTITAQSAVIMAPLSLPPGPWFETFLRNDGLGYTDGFNFHYYGYAADLQGDYEMFLSAVGGKKQRSENLESRSQNGSSVAGDMECGDPHRFRREVSPLAPGGEASRAKRGRTSHSTSETSVPQGRDSRLLLAPNSSPALSGAEGLLDSSSRTWRPFTPFDFGLSKPAPWMSLIGAKVGAWEASPALAYLLGSRASTWPSRESKRWVVTVPRPSPVVIDVIGADGMHPFKQYSGYWIEGEVGHPGSYLARASVVVYNFSDETVRGRLVLPEQFVRRSEEPFDSAQSRRGARSENESRSLSGKERRVINMECGDLAPPSTGGPDRPLRRAEVSESETSRRKSSLASKGGIEIPHSISISSVPPARNRTNTILAAGPEPAEWASRFPPALSAVAGAPNASFPSLSSVQTKSLPIFMTEFGYASLSKRESWSIQGRVRQWEWFRDAVAQIHQLGIEGAMAFYVPPYFESGLFEFGLAIDPRIQNPEFRIQELEALEPKPVEQKATKVTKITKAELEEQARALARQEAELRKQAAQARERSEEYRRERSEERPERIQNLESRIPFGRLRACGEGDSGGISGAERRNDMECGDSHRHRREVSPLAPGGEASRAKRGITSHSTGNTLPLKTMECGGSTPSRACGNARPVKILSGVERDSRPEVSGAETSSPAGGQARPSTAVPQARDRTPHRTDAADNANGGLGQSALPASTVPQARDAASTILAAGPEPAEWAPSSSILDSSSASVLTLAPHSRTVIPVWVAFDARRFVGHEIEIRFVPQQRSEEPFDRLRTCGEGDSGGVSGAERWNDMECGDSHRHRREVSPLAPGGEASRGSLLSSAEPRLRFGSRASARNVEDRQIPKHLCGRSSPPVKGGAEAPHSIVGHAADNANGGVGQSALPASTVPHTRDAASTILAAGPEPASSPKALSLSNGLLASSIWASRLWPDANGMRCLTVASLSRPAAASAVNRRTLEALPRVREEPPRLASGPGFATPGVKIEALPDGWRITVERDEPDPKSGYGELYPWLAEIPWPDGQAFPAGSLLSFLYASPNARPEGAGFDFRIRTANGDLFGVMPPLTAHPYALTYLQARGNFTPVFYGRMNLPWRFQDNRPVALVFQLRPRHLPAVYEFRSPRLVRYER